MSALIFLLLFAPAFAAAAPKERIIRLTSNNPVYRLYLSDRDGRNERPFFPNLRPNYNPSFSWDGRWIVFTSLKFGSADVFRAHPDGSGLERLTHSPAFDDQGSLSPDGKTLAFVSTRGGGTANIWLLDIASRRVRNLTQNKAGNFRPSWSPDGKWIAFSSDRDTPRMRYMRGTDPAWELMQTTAIYIVHPDGSGLRRLTPLGGSAATPKWSRDGRHLLFAQAAVGTEARRQFSRLSEVVSIDIYTGEREVHSGDTQWVWSPGYVGDMEIGYGVGDPYGVRGSMLAYSSGRKGPADAQNPSWSPDGSLLVYDKDVRNRDSKWVVRTSQDPRYELINALAFQRGNDHVAVTPDGARFIYPSGSQLTLSGWDGKDSRAIFDGSAENQVIHDVALSANGRTIAFGSWNPKRPESNQIAVMNVDGSHFRVVTHGYDFFPSLSPDGTRLVYRVGGPHTIAAGGLRILSLANGKVTKLTTGADDFPVWSPCGDRIAFTGFETGDFEIYTIRPDGTGLRQLTHSHGNDAHPVWSPDGHWIAFSSSRMGWKDEAMLPWHGPQTYGELFVMRADGTDVRQLSDSGRGDAVGGWAPPGSGAAGSARLSCRTGSAGQ